MGGVFGGEVKQGFVFVGESVADFALEAFVDCAVHFATVWCN